MRPARIAALASLLALSTAAEADVFSDALKSCVLREFGNGASPASIETVCVGILSNPCMQKPGGDSTVGMQYCLQAEHKAWDDLLNAYWPQMRSFAQSLDANGANNAADLSLTAQRAWIEFRDNRCGFQAAQFTGGTFAGTAYLYCQRDMTARRTIEIMDTVGRER